MYFQTIAEFSLDKGEKLIYDLRKEKDHNSETIPGAVHLPWEKLEQAVKADDLSFLPKDVTVYIFCYTDKKADDLALAIREKGYENLYSISGGYSSYARFKLNGLVTNEAELAEKTKEIERSIIKKFKKDIWRQFTKAINEYEMIQDGDRIAVCISGGKDSMILAKLFQELERHGKKNFEVVYIGMDPGYNQVNREMIEYNSKLLNIPVHTFKTEIFDTVVDIKDSRCYLCARMRRGDLYSKAQELGCNKIALGHHFDDVIETIVMGMMYGGQVQTMMPKLHSTNFPGMELIRPLYLIRERDIIHWSKYNGLNFIRCACRFTEQSELNGEDENTSKRAEVKALIAQLEKQNPYVPKNIFRSVENVNLSTIIAYKNKGKKHHFLDDYN